jgi:ABC-type dipeptide/oligopeptide/nickel transport system permease subunit
VTSLLEAEAATRHEKRRRNRARILAPGDAATRCCRGRRRSGGRVRGGGNLPPDRAHQLSGHQSLAPLAQPRPDAERWHVLGTDELGRDILVRTLYGLHMTEQSALLATLLASSVGVVLGGLAGYRGAWVDSLIVRFGDMLGVFPAILLLLVAYTYFIPVTVGKAPLVIAFYLWIQVARVVRAEFARFARANSSRQRSPSAPRIGGSSSTTCFRMRAARSSSRQPPCSAR